MSQVRALLLAAGLGTRLLPLTDHWPKCLMPIGDRPLLEYWLETLWKSGVREVLVNLHYLPTVVQDFFWTDLVFKAGFIPLGKQNCLGQQELFEPMPIISGNVLHLLLHADNWCQCQFWDFLKFHQQERPASTLMTMMTFDSDNPSILWNCRNRFARCSPSFS